MFGAEVSRVSGEPAPIPAYLTDKRLKIRISKLPEKVREMLHRKGYVGLMVGDTLTWTHYDMDKPFIRISLNPVLRGLIQRAEGGARKIRSQNTLQQTLLGHKIREGLRHGRKHTILHRERQGTTTSIYKDLKGTNTAKRTNYAPTNIRVLEKEVGVVKKEKSKLKHLLDLEHENLPIQLDLWGNEVIFMGKGRQHCTDTQGQRHEL
jgi:hypothetical protein